MISAITPPTSLATARLDLRACRIEDEPAISALWRANLDRFEASFPDTVASIRERGDAAAIVASRAAEWEARAGFWYGAWDRDGARLVGHAHVKRIDWKLGRGELAYLLDHEAEGRGLAVEAVRRVIVMAFDDLGLHKLFLRAVVGNDRSERVAVRCGFTLEGTLRGEFLARGTDRVDVRYYGLLATDATRPR